MRRSMQISGIPRRTIVEQTHKVSKMDMSFRIEQYIVRLDISMNDALLVDILKSTPKLGNPKPHGFLLKRLP